MSDRRGLALVATLLVLTVMAVLVAAAVRASMTSVRTAGLEYHEARAFYAAEAGAEAALSQLKLALHDGHLQDAELEDIAPPAVEEFNYDSFAVFKQGEPVVEAITDGPFNGLYALTQNVEVYSLAEDEAGTLSGVILAAKAQAIPIFQFGVFFEEDLEATNGPPMHFFGRVHSNGNIYLSSRNAWYHEMITTPNKIFHDRKDHHLIYDGVYIDDAEGSEVQLDFDSRTIPGAEAFKQQSCERFDCRLQTDAFNVDSLALPLPEGVPAYELIRPREESDTDPEIDVKFAWNADMYVTVDLTDIGRRPGSCSEPALAPELEEGDIIIAPLDDICPGAGWITFRASRSPLACEDFDERAYLLAKAGSWQYSGDMSGCTFQVYVPPDAEGLEIEIQLDAAQYDELDEDARGKVRWNLEDVPPAGTGDPTPWPNIAVERPAGFVTPSSSDAQNIFQWRWSAFYDGREQELKDVLNIDIVQLNAWAGTDTTRASQVIYVEFVAPSSISGYSPDTRDQVPDATVDPAIRLVNGNSLPNPLTVASEWPVYVKGDYNAVNKQPAALVGDGINILSNDWRDDENRLNDMEDCEGDVWEGHPCEEFEDLVDDWRYKNSTETTVNAAVLAGHWPTPCDHELTGCSGGYDDFYGGGIENFPRFLERWRYPDNSKVIFHYKGALISPFTSQKTTGTWNGTYYVPPERDWSFDTDFRDPEKLPPGTPNVGYVLRTAMREAF